MRRRHFLANLAVWAPLSAVAAFFGLRHPTGRVEEKVAQNGADEPVWLMRRRWVTRDELAEMFPSADEDWERAPREG